MADTPRALQIRAWEAINAYAATRTGVYGNTSRQDAVVMVEDVLADIRRAEALTQLEWALEIFGQSHHAKQLRDRIKRLKAEVSGG